MSQSLFVGQNGPLNERKARCEAAGNERQFSKCMLPCPKIAVFPKIVNCLVFSNIERNRACSNVGRDLTCSNINFQQAFLGNVRDRIFSKPQLYNTSLGHTTSNLDSQSVVELL